MKSLIVVAGILTAELIVGCRYRPNPDVWHYMSKEPNPSVVVSRPGWSESKRLAMAGIILFMLENGMGECINRQKCIGAR